MSIVTIAAIPLVVPALTSLAVREAARIVNTQLSAAQSQALANGRSAGLWIERVGGTSSTTPGGVDLYMAEVPPPYSGDTSNSTVTIQTDPSPPNNYYFSFNAAADTAWQNLPLRPGDEIRFNYKGPLYILPSDVAAYTSPNQQPVNTVKTDAQGNKYIDPASTKIYFDRLPTFWSHPSDCPMPMATSAGVPYQIFRQPVKTAGSPVQLPTGAVIDFNYSGEGTDAANASSNFDGSHQVPMWFGNIQNPSQFQNDKNPIVITFDKSGARKPVRHGAGRAYRATVLFPHRQAREAERH